MAVGSAVSAFKKPYRIQQVKYIERMRNLGISQTREDGVKAATSEDSIHSDPDDGRDGYV